LGISLKYVVGYYSFSGGNHAYVEAGASFVDADPDGSTTSYLTSVNRYGVAAGGYCKRGCNEEAGEHGYTYDIKTGKTTVIDFPLTGAATTAYGINDFGVVVGGYCPDATSCPQGAFNPASDGFVDTNGAFTTLNYPKAQATSPCAINDAGTIVGFYLINNTGPHGFLYQKSQFTTLDFPGAGYTIATGINNSGVVAGLFSSSTGVHGFTYYDGAFTQIDKPGATSTAVANINDHNDLVGTWNPAFGTQNFKAVPVAGR